MRRISTMISVVYLASCYITYTYATMNGPKDSQSESATQQTTRVMPSEGVSESGLTAILQAVQTNAPLDHHALLRLSKRLGRQPETLSSNQADRVWNLLDVLDLNRSSTESSRKGRHQWRMNAEQIRRANLLFLLFSKMNPEDMRAIPQASKFPGKVADSADRVTRSILLDTSETRWQSTGLYAPPGEVISVTPPPSLQNLGLHIQIGCHQDNLSRKDTTRRWPRIVMRRFIHGPSSRIANPFGGLVYLVVPNDAPKGIRGSVVVRGAVNAPRFILGRTDPEIWRKTIRSFPGPWAELESDRLVATVPSSAIRDLDDPTAITEFWSRVAYAQDELSGRLIPRYKERMVCDIQISAGGLHSGYPMMGHLNSAHPLTDFASVSKSGSWGWFHELGHNHQRFPWKTPVEVSVNIFSMYSMEQVVGLETENVGWYKKCAKAARSFYEAEPVNGREAWKEGFALPLAMHMYLRKAFGWEIYRKVFKAYEDMDHKQWPRDPQKQRDLWVATTSKSAGRNLAPYFERWGFVASEQVQKSLADLPVWNPSVYR